MYNLSENLVDELVERPGKWNLATLWEHWLARRSVRRLQAYEDHVLFDMGIDRHDIDWAVKLPLWRNAAQELDERGLRRRIHETHAIPCL